MSYDDEIRKYICCEPGCRNHAISTPRDCYEHGGILYCSQCKEKGQINGRLYSAKTASKDEK